MYNYKYYVCESVTQKYSFIIRSLHGGLCRKHERFSLADIFEVDISSGRVRISYSKGNGGKYRSMTITKNTDVNGKIQYIHIQYYGGSNGQYYVGPDKLVQLSINEKIFTNKDYTKITYGDDIYTENTASLRITGF